MEETVLEAKRRDVIGKQVKALRREGRMPAVIYGRKVAPIAITLDLREASRTLIQITSSHLVTVNIDGERHRTLIREKQRNPLNGHLLHVDFLEVSMTETLRATVPLVFEGDAPAVKELNGVLVTSVESVSVECLPGDLPDRIVVDVSGLHGFDDNIYIRDLVLPPKVEVLNDPDETVVAVTPPVGEELEPGEAEGAEEEPEVIERGKKEEEEI